MTTPATNPNVAYIALNYSTRHGFTVKQEEFVNLVAETLSAEEGIYIGDIIVYLEAHRTGGNLRDNCPPWVLQYAIDYWLTEGELIASQLAAKLREIRRKEVAVITDYAQRRDLNERNVQTLRPDNLTPDMLRSLSSSKH